MWRKTIVVSEPRGLRASVTEWSRQGFPCILIHGFGEASCVWNHLAIRLAPVFRVLAIDLRGHGDSDWDPDTNYDTETSKADLERIVSAYGFERVLLVGHSLGADVAIGFAAENPSRVAATVIVDFGPELEKAGLDQVLSGFAATPRTFPSPDDYLQLLLAGRPLGDPASLRSFARYNLRQSSAQSWEIKTDPALADRSQISRLATDDARYRDETLWPKLGRLAGPSLVVRGSGSGVFPHDVASRMVERALPNGHLMTVPAAGHAVMMDNPAAFSTAVVGFLSGVQPWHG